MKIKANNAAKNNLHWRTYSQHYELFWLFGVSQVHLGMLTFCGMLMRCLEDSLLSTASAIQCLVIEVPRRSDTESRRTSSSRSEYIKFVSVGLDSWVTYDNGQDGPLTKIDF